MLTYHTYIYISLWFVNYDLWHTEPPACVALHLLSNGSSQWLPNVHIIPTRLRLRLFPLHSQNIIILKLCCWRRLWLSSSQPSCIVFWRLNNRRILKLWWIGLARGNRVWRDIFLLWLHHLSRLTYYFCWPYNFLFSSLLLCWGNLNTLLFFCQTNNSCCDSPSWWLLRF